MAHERGLPSVPRGLGRELTAYLQAVQNVVLSLSGLGRGTRETQAVRVSDASRLSTGAATAALGQGSVLTWNIAAGAVTSAKLADGCVSAEKLAASAVTERALMDGAVGGHALQGRCVTLEKLDEALLPQAVEGVAENGETVELGAWEGVPGVAITGWEISIEAGGTVRTGLENLRKEGGFWRCEAVARCETSQVGTGGNGGLGKTVSTIAGKIWWRATGIRGSADAGE